MNCDRLPRLIVGLPVYNGEDFLEDSLKGLLSQTYTNFKIVISDNGSTDKTQQICQDYAARDSRIDYHRHEINRGAAWNYNYAFEVERSEYFKWAAHDDICQPEYLERCVEILDRYPSVVLAYPRTRFIDERGELIRPDYTDDLNLRQSKPHQRYGQYLDVLYRTGPQGCSKISPIWGVIRTEILRKTPLIGNYNASDLTLLSELALWGEFFEIPEYLFLRREHAGQSVKAHRSASERAAWFDPTNKRVTLPTWERFGHFLRAIDRVNLSWSEKVLCYLELRRWLLFSPMGWRKMGREVKMSLLDYLEYQKQRNTANIKN